MNWVCANTECGLPLRRSSVPYAQAPGTQQHAADGLCKRCYNNRRRDTEYLTPEQLTQARSALDGWLTARRNRINKGPQRCVKPTKPYKKPATHSKS